MKLEVNSLVTHNKLRHLGIGCVSKILKGSVKVNFGTEDCISVSPKRLSLIDTSECKTISFHAFTSKIIGSNKCPDICIVGNEVKEYVGIGWITLRVVTMDDLTKYPRVI